MPAASGLAAAFAAAGFAPKQWKSLKRKIFPSKPARKRAALFAMLGFGASCAGAKPAKDSSKKEILEAWARCYSELRRAGFGAVILPHAEPPALLSCRKER